MPRPRQQRLPQPSNLAARPAPRIPAPARPRLRGRGDYADAVTSISRPLPRLEAKIDHLERSLVHATPKLSRAASTIGRTLGNFVGLGDVGALAGESLSNKLFGSGDYMVKSNSLMTNTGNSMVPKFSSSDRGTTITEREYLGRVSAGTLVSGATLFTNQVYNINPTDPNTFPWLSTIALKYDQWRPNGIVFQFLSTSSDFNGSSQALGSVIMATDYDPYDLPYPNKQEMENADFTCATKPSCSLIHGVECAVSERPTPLLYTSTVNGAPLTSSLLGKFQIATDGCSTTGAVLGDLWVSYDITFFKKTQHETASSLPFYHNIFTPNAGDHTLTQPNISPTPHETITIRDDPVDPDASRIDFNNVAVGTRYQITARIDDNSTGNFTTASSSGSGSVLESTYQTISGVPGQSATYVYVYRTIAVNAFVNVTAFPFSTGITLYLSVTATNPSYTLN